MALEILPAHPEHASALTALAIAAKKCWGYPDSWIQEWEHALTITPGFILQYPTFVAFHHHEILGFYGVMPAWDHHNLEHLWVTPSHTREGVGTTLFQHAARRAHEKGVPVLAIESDPNALAFFMKQGAVVVGYRLCCVGGVIRSLPLLKALTAPRQLPFQ